MNRNNREKKEGKGRKELLAYFLSFVSWNGAELKGYD